MNSVQVNQIVQVTSSKTNEKIIGLVTKILRKSSPLDNGAEEEMTDLSENTIKVNLVGTLKELIPVKVCQRLFRNGVLSYSQWIGTA